MEIADVFLEWNAYAERKVLFPRDFDGDLTATSGTATMSYRGDMGASNVDFFASEHDLGLPMPFGDHSGVMRFQPTTPSQGLAVNPEVRSDQILWVDAATSGASIRGYLARLEELRQTLNRELFLGLEDFEGHLAIYPPGSFYRRHLDQFRGVERRTLSCILYLNSDWQPDDGGALRIYVDPSDPERFAEVAPEGGTLVTFLSARFEHEVLPARRERLSLTGWLRRRG